MPKLLIVEDNRIFREILKEALASILPSMDIEESEDGKDVLRKIEEQNFDIIFMDIQLPEENGLALTKKIKSLHAHIPVIIITGYDTVDYRQAAAEAGADFFFSKKDFKSSDITGLVESLLNY